MGYDGQDRDAVREWTMSFGTDFVAGNSEIITRLFVGNLEYVLLITSMMMTRMLMLRMFAISSGVAGAS